MVAFGFKPLPGSAARALMVTVSRYTPQAVLVANVEEARYEVLASEDGKMLVRARYAVRNNQRAFLALKLPAQSILWSAALEGRPIRPGVSADGGYLLPLLKGRAGESAPTFAVELVYLQRMPAWTDKGEARVELPAVDLPVSRTGLVVNHSPRFSGRAQAWASSGPKPEQGPWSVRRSRTRTSDVGPRRASSRHHRHHRRNAPSGEAGDREGASAKALVDRFRKDMGRTAAGTIPVNVAVPDIGPSFFAAAELTAEAQAPALNVQYKRLSER